MEILNSIRDWACDINWEALVIFFGIMMALFGSNATVLSNQKLKWIDELRDELSNYLSEINNLITSYHNMHNFSVLMARNEKKLNITIKEHGFEKTNLIVDWEKTIIELRQKFTDARNDYKKYYFQYTESTRLFEKHQYKVLFYLSKKQSKHKEILKKIGAIKQLYDETNTTKTKILLPMEFEKGIKKKLNGFEDAVHELIHKENQTARAYFNPVTRLKQ